MVFVDGHAEGIDARCDRKQLAVFQVIRYGRSAKFHRNSSLVKFLVIWLKPMHLQLVYVPFRHAFILCWREFRSYSKIKFTFPVSFGCLSPVLSVVYVHTLLSGQEKNSSK